ncbi:LacI family DNA-binding transcriptional regulator [Pokkaliibacter sp. MBI-7]|uniref:LacI family DNA-binding transcriptional regulator n=1 Tax=Pokkaliibacter sp. MBI-7 TaxID=3040600 RepID=UPI00244CC13C|nr:LacI family DNA-binding transcriptional regulator [Pokkaliibacter sp. MBI-7]MDH2433732.1 LacI family DNA-binding transcriptional regulator [Pokkaliibacter sp. MBI-7]
MSPQTTAKKLTLKDVARALKVSTATISNAFNRPDQLSAELRRHILSECQRMGYHGPNATARSLRTGRSGIVGIVLSDNLSYSVTDPVASEFLHGVAEVFDEQQTHMLLLSSAPHGSGYTQLPDSMVDGFIVYGAPIQSTILSRLLQQHKPIVTVDFNWQDFPAVNVTNQEGALDSARHALRQRPQQVAVLGLRLVDTDRVCRVTQEELLDASASVSIQRLRGYQQALAEVDVPLTTDWIWNIPSNSLKFAQQAAREALMSFPRPDLLLCMSDRIAQAATQCAQHLGLRVPEDVRIIGFDDIPEAQIMSPSLTTVHQQNVEKGRQAARLFLGLTDDTQVVIPTELVIRASCP